MERLGQLMSSGPFFGAVRAFRYQGTNGAMPALIACASRQQARDLWSFLAESLWPGQPPPALVLGETPAGEREQALADFAAGRLDTLVQVGVLIEGWSSPRCKLLIDLAPSVSRVRATQQYFRVMTRNCDQEGLTPHVAKRTQLAAQAKTSTDRPRARARRSARRPHTRAGRAVPYPTVPC